MDYKQLNGVEPSYVAQKFCSFKHQKLKRDRNLMKRKRHVPSPKIRRHSITLAAIKNDI